jgi:SAM-dependent methyltransferase
MISLLAAAYEKAILAHAAGALVDLGCGDVPLYGTYGPRASEVTCADWPRSRHALSHVDCFVDLNAPLPFASGRFDTALATDVVEHLADPRLFIREVARVLKPGGKLILGAPFMYWLHEEPHDHLRLTRYQLAHLCAENELEVLQLDAYGGPIAVLLDIIGKVVPGAPVAWLVQSLGARFLSSGAGRRLDTQHRDKFPLGYCMVAVKR